MEWTLDRVQNISDELAYKLLNEFEPIQNSKTNAIDLGKKLHGIGVITPMKGKTHFTDDDYGEKWGSYVGIFTSNGLGYTERIDNGIILHITPIALQLKNKSISYEKFIITILSRIQIPKPNGKGYVANEIYDKPFIKILKILYLLYQYDKGQAWIDYYDIVNHLEVNNYICNYIQIYNDILNDRIQKKDRNILIERDILINKCKATGLVIQKEKKRFYINDLRIQEIRELIIEQQSNYFIGEKAEWYEYFGGEV